MARVFFLGTAAAVPTLTQDNSSILFESNSKYLMIDCSGTPYRKLLHLGIEPNNLQHIIITHPHIDHCYGLPSLIECLWIAGRKEALHIYALSSALSIIEPLLDLFKLRHRMIKNFPIEIHTIEGFIEELVLNDENFKVQVSPTFHAIPSFATRLTFPNGSTFVYSSDTAPTQNLIDFAKGADDFVMECTYCDEDGELAELTRHIHSSEWGDIASQVGAGRNFLIHHSDTENCNYKKLLAEIEKGSSFPADKVIIPQDLDQFELKHST